MVKVLRVEGFRVGEILRLRIWSLEQGLMVQDVGFRV